MIAIKFKHLPTVTKVSVFLIVSLMGNIEGHSSRINKQIEASTKIKTITTRETLTKQSIPSMKESFSNFISKGVNISDLNHNEMNQLVSMLNNRVTRNSSDIRSSEPQSETIVRDDESQITITKETQNPDLIENLSNQSTLESEFSEDYRNAWMLNMSHYHTSLYDYEEQHWSTFNPNLSLTNYPR